MDHLDLSFMSLDENDNSLMKKIDEIFTNEVLKHGAVEYHLPTMVKGEVLEKCEYFNSFPQHLTVPAFVKKENYEKVVKDKEIVNRELAMHNIFLTPSACFGLYPMLDGKDVNEKIFTMNVNVFRYEEGRFDGEVRFWDFNVREVVFVGNNDYVNKMMEEFKAITQKVADNIGIPMNITKATDHFYPTTANIVKTRFQRSNALKFEMISTVNGKEVALGSFNYHNNHFSVPFHFDQDGRIVSACIGYGLQRWFSAIKSYGDETKKKVLEYEIK